MEIKKAFRIFENITSEKIGYLDKLEAVQEVVNCPTLNSITKDQLKAACGFLLEKALETIGPLEHQHNPDCMVEAPLCICNICKNDRAYCCKEKIYDGREGVHFGCCGEAGLSVRGETDLINQIFYYDGSWCPDFEMEDSDCLMKRELENYKREEQEADSNEKSQSAGAFGILPGK